MYSQPSNDEHSDGSGETADHSTLISIAASYALETIGDKDRVKGQLPPRYHEAFDLAYSVQEVKAQQEGLDKAQRQRQRTAEEVEKRRAAFSASQLIVEEARAALYAAAETEGDGIGELLSAVQLKDLPKAKPLVEGFLNRESVVRLYGEPKSFKSFVMLDMAGCIGAGIAWHGKRTVQTKVLYVVAEGAQGIERRVTAWEALNKRPMSGVYFHPKAVQMGERDQVERLIRTVKRGGFGMVILDTQARVTVGLEENSASEMGQVIAALDVLKEVTGACVALVHHSGAAGGRARGSTAILGAVDAEFMVKPDKRSMSVELITTAQKDLAEHPAITMDLVTPGPGLALAVKPRPAGTWYQGTVADRTPLKASEMMALRTVASFFNGAPLTMIAEDLGVNKGTVYKTLDALHRKGCIMKRGATYKVEATGQEYLDADHGE